MSAPQTAAILLIVLLSALAGAAGGGAFSNTSPETSQELDTQSDSPLIPEVEQEPQSTKLNDSTDPSYEDKTLAKHTNNKAHLVHVKVATNQKWWEWVHKNRFVPKKASQQGLSTLFNTVQTAYEEFSDAQATNKTSLNYVCHYAYTKKYLDFEEGDHLLENIKLFCTSGTTNLSEPEDKEPENPTTLNTANGTTIENTKLGGEDTNKTHFVAAVKTADTDNAQQNWWRWVYKKHFLAKKKEAGYTINAHFKKVTSAYSATPVNESTDNDETSLNQACNEVYKKALPVETEDLKKNVANFCTKGIQEVTVLKFVKGS